MSTFLKDLWAKTPVSASFSTPAVELPMGSSEPLLNSSGQELALDERVSEKCELRIEGMTCSSCVKVRNIHVMDLLDTEHLAGYRGYAALARGYTFSQGRLARRTRGRRI